MQRKRTFSCAIHWEGEIFGVLLSEKLIFTSEEETFRCDRNLRNG